MVQFEGKVNGQVFTDAKEYEKALKEAIDSDNLRDTTYSYHECNCDACYGKCKRESTPEQALEKEDLALPQLEDLVKFDDPNQDFDCILDELEDYLDERMDVFKKHPFSEESYVTNIPLVQARLECYKTALKATGKNMRELRRQIKATEALNEAQEMFVNFYEELLSHLALNQKIQETPEDKRENLKDGLVVFKQLCKVLGV